MFQLAAHELMSVNKAINTELGNNFKVLKISLPSSHSNFLWERFTVSLWKLSDYRLGLDNSSL